MKPCKGCMHLIDAWSDCTRFATYRHVTDEVTGVEFGQWEGLVACKSMRAPGSACGPERSEYNTFWRSIKKWFWGQNIDGRT